LTIYIIVANVYHNAETGTVFCVFCTLVVSDIKLSDHNL